MTPNRIPVVIGFLILLFICTASSGETGGLSGVVFAENGDPAADAQVDMVDLHRRVQVTSDATFKFEDVPPGKYLVQALSRRYGSGVAEVEVTAGQTAEIEIRLDLASQVDEIVVTVAGDAKSRHELTQAVNVLSGEELSLRLQPSLGETLAQEPGVTSTYFGPGSSRPVIRGLGGDRVRMLEDGLGTGDASATSADHAVSVDAGTAERIEVVRGPSTLLYGSSAIGGVVNVIDGKIPDYQLDEVSGSIELRGGSVSNERGGSVALNGGSGRWAWHVSGGRRDADDLNIPGFAEAEGEEHEEDGHEEEGEHEEEEVRGTLPNSDLETASAALGATYFFGRDKGFLGVSVSGFDTQYGLPGGHGHEEGEEHEEEGEEHEEEDEEHEEEGEDVRIDLERRRIDLRGEITQVGAFEALKFRWGMADYEHVELEGEEIGTIFNSDAWEGRFELVQKPRGNRTGSFGLQIRDRDFEAIGEEAFVPPTKTRGWALFAFQEWEIESLTWQIGGRFEQTDVEAEGSLPDRDFDGFSASAGLLWDIDDTYSLGVSLARSTKLPNAEELYSDGPHLATSTFELGNPDLEEETSLGLDLALRWRGERASGELTFFVNRFDDFIYQRFTGAEEDELPVVLYAQDDAEFAGVELETRFEIWESGTAHLDVHLFGDFVEAELSDSGEPLPRIPAMRYGAGLHYHNDRFHGMVEARRTDEQDRLAVNETSTAGFTFVNASVSYRFYRAGLAYDLLLRGTNLTDEEGRNHVSFLKDQVPLPGRDVSLALRLWF